MRTFVDTARAAFSSTNQPHATVTSDLFFARLPCGEEGVGRNARSTAKVFFNQRNFLLLQRVPQFISLDDREVKVHLQNGLPPLPQLELYAEACLAQLRLWVVGGTRQAELASCVQWFELLNKKYAQKQGLARVAAGTSVIARANELSMRAAETSSNLNRICGLMQAKLFVGELNSKQQGEYLRGGDMVRQERLLARRALGSDIVFHDAVTNVISALPPKFSEEKKQDDENNTTNKEESLVSYYGGCTFAESVRAAGVP